MHGFSVSFERWSDANETSGMLASDLSLHDAVRAVRNATSKHSETVCTLASDSDPRAAFWVSTESHEFLTGDYVILYVHFPRNVTPSSRARLARILTREL